MLMYIRDVSIVAIFLIDKCNMTDDSVAWMKIVFELSPRFETSLFRNKSIRNLIVFEFISGLI